MPNWLTISLIYLIPLLLILLVYWLKRRKKHIKSSEFLEISTNDGLIEAPTLHPIIDSMFCIGCSSCVSACPEKNVLGLIHRKAELINPASCIGHGACKTACPEQAITLVFGSARRGIEIPEVSPSFESNIPGLYIAGELGGMGLIKNAIEQGRQALDSIVKHLKSSSSKAGILDCIIVGSGPAGLSASLGAKKYQLNSITIDQDQIGGTVSHFPRGKLVMTQTATMPLVGKVKFGEIHKEDLLKFWFKTIKEHQIKIQEHETLLSATPNDSGGFEVKTSKQTYQTKTILLTIGRRGSPRKLNVDGEKLPKVVYRLIDPEQYRGKSVLIVGGGDSAIEAACSIAELAGSEVSLSYRKDNFSRAKAKNRERLEKLVSSNQLHIFYSSSVKIITNDKVTIIQGQKEISLDNQAVIICAGGILPTGLLQAIGVTIATKYGEE